MQHQVSFNQLASYVMSIFGWEIVYILDFKLSMVAANLKIYHDAKKRNSLPRLSHGQWSQLLNKFDEFFVSKMENGKGVVISMQTCASTPTPSRYFSTHESIHNTQSRVPAFLATEQWQQQSHFLQELGYMPHPCCVSS